MQAQLLQTSSLFHFVNHETSWTLGASQTCRVSRDSKTLSLLYLKYHLIYW